MKTRYLILPMFLLLAISFFSTRSALADDPPQCRELPDGSILCEASGGDEPPGTGTCVPGTHLEIRPRPVVGSPGFCYLEAMVVDNCTGEPVGSSWGGGVGYCQLPGPPAPVQNPCVLFQIGPGGITCGTEWLVSASVGYPETTLDLRPYPASLVRWPTAARCSALPPAAGSGTLAYYSPAGGSPSDPRPGDWRDLTLTLTLAPAGPMFFSLPQIGELVLPPVGDDGAPFLFQWERPSHPAAGGSVLAGAIPGLAELPDDIPLFVGQARSPYRLFWRLSYEEYVEKEQEECVAGPNSDGVFECKTDSQQTVNNGHIEIVNSFEWEAHEQGGEVEPSMVQGLSPQLAADLDRNGTPDAFWNTNVTIRRMDEAGRVDNPEWAASWNWGGVVYWAVREAQGQIGWP